MAMASVVNEEQIGKMHGNRSYVNFGRTEFLEIVHVEKPGIIYRGEGRHFFFLVGLAVSSMECSEDDFHDQLVIPWISESAP